VRWGLGGMDSDGTSLAGNVDPNNGTNILDTCLEQLLGNSDSQDLDIDQSFLDEAVRQSLETEANHQSLQNIQVGSPEVDTSEPIKTPMTKPAARFVKDITFPDGTSVTQGTVFRKIWQIRNDGDCEWPEGIVLVCAGGDLLCNPDIRQPVASISPGEEAEVYVQLTAPVKTGRHTAYFRFQTATGSNFGQRLWADIRVIEEDNGWAVVSGSGLLCSEDFTFVKDEKNAEGIDEVLEATFETVKVEEITISDNISLPVPSLDAQSQPDSSPIEDSSFVSVNNDDLHEFLNAAEIPAALEGSVNLSQDENYLKVWGQVWGKELQLLAEMGFTDVKVLIPLFQEHIGVPVSLCDDLQGVPPPERIQLVVNHMLSRSGLNL